MSKMDFITVILGVISFLFFLLLLFTQSLITKNIKSYAPCLLKSLVFYLGGLYLLKRVAFS